MTVESPSTGPAGTTAAASGGVVPVRRSLAIAGGAVATVMVGAAVPVNGLLAHYPLLSGQAIRYAIGAIALYGWLRARGRRLRRPGRRDLIGLAGMVGAGMLGFNAAQLVAQRYAEPGFVAAVLGGAPVILALLAPFLHGRRPTWGVLAGAVVVVAGVVVLSGSGSWHGPGLLLSVLALAGEILFTIAGMGVTARLGVLETCTLACGMAAVIGAGLGTVLAGPVAAWPAPTPIVVIAVLLMALFTVIAYCGWYAAVSVLGADRAGVLTGLTPVAGFVVAVSLGAQPFGGIGVVGALVVGFGCAIGLRRGT